MPPSPSHAPLPTLPSRSTRANIYKGIQWLMTDLVPGTCLVFHFSGHGSQKRAVGRDEADGYDETICPSDFQRAGQIVDNELNQMLVRPLPPGVVLHCVIDACHSGTAFGGCVNEGGMCGGRKEGGSVEVGACCLLL